jgi:hypothetical protein
MFSRKVRAELLPIALLLLLTVGIFADVLFLPGEKVLSHTGEDLFAQHIHWRAFGFGELKKGNLALWNPHIYCGAPFFGGMQSALLYPPNWIFLALPLAKAVNASIALHVFLAGLFMYLWARHRGLHRPAAFFSGSLLMLGGTCFPHIYAGHLPNLCTMVWAPLLFLSIDGLFAVETTGSTGPEKPRRPGPGWWILLGAFAFSMQIFAGHPQYVFYTAVAAGIYFALRLSRAEKRLEPAVSFIALFVFAASLSAVQLLSGVDASAEAVRSGGVPFKFASMYSFPWENLGTLLAPDLFGGPNRAHYWGKWSPAEMTLFISLAGLVLAVYGAVRGPKSRRPFHLSMIAILFVLALGKRTPLFPLLYRFVPGFDLFRGSSKFTFPLSLFLVMLAGVGLDHLLRSEKTSRIPALLSVLSAAVIGGLSLAVRVGSSAGDPNGWWARLMASVYGTGESLLPLEVRGKAALFREAGRDTAASLAWAAAVLLVAAAFFYWSRRSRTACYAFVAMAILELLLFVRWFRPTFPLAEAIPPIYEQFARARPGDGRVFNMNYPDKCMSAGLDAIWGYDPIIPKRYAELVFYSQGKDPDKAGQQITFEKIPRLYSMLRLTYLLQPEDDSLRYRQLADPMPRLKLISRYRVVAGRDRILADMTAASSDFGSEVLLESEPRVSPDSTGPPGTVRLVDASTDRLEIEADLERNSILLITDGYAGGWRVRALSPGPQDSYQVMPADYALRAVPLKAGSHHFVVEYSPGAFRIGRVISAGSWLVFLGVAVVLFRSRGPQVMGA